MSCSTVDSLLLLYSDCMARGENVTLAMESKEGRQVVTFTLKQEKEDDGRGKLENINGELNVNVERMGKAERDPLESEKSRNMRRERLVFPAQYSGPISCEKAAKKLRRKWPESVVRMVTVRKTAEAFNERCGLDHLEVEVFVEPGYDFDNYFARPANDDNWPHGFVPAYICNCKLYETNT